jgi:drug/metabolite transporter (DMT)-like permease
MPFPYYVYILMLILIISGSINTITNKIQNHSKSLNIVFFHIWFLTFLMFIAEITSLIIYYIFYDKKEQKSNNNRENNNNIENNIIEEENKQLKPIKLYLLCIPPIFDLTGTSLMTFGLTMVSGSVYQMLRGSLIIFTFILSLYYLKNKHNCIHYMGVIFIIIGLFLVGLSAYFNKNEYNSKNSFLGIFLIIFSNIFVAIQYIYEENIVKNYNCHPFKLVGFEGFFGIIYSSILIFIFYFINCNNFSQNFKENFCSFDGENWRVENIFFAFKQLKNNVSLLLITILYVFSIAIYNISGISVSKFTTSTTRAVVDVIRTIIIWMFFMLPFNKEEIREKFNVLQLFGFILLIIGNIIYNEIFNVNEVVLGKNKNEENKSENNECDETAEDEKGKLLNENN